MSNNALEQNRIKNLSFRQRAEVCYGVVMAVAGCVCDVDILTGCDCVVPAHAGKTRSVQWPHVPQPPVPPPSTPQLCISVNKGSVVKGLWMLRYTRSIVLGAKNLVKTHRLFERKNEGLFGFERSFKQFHLNSFVSCLVLEKKPEDLTPIPKTGKLVSVCVCACACV